MDGQIFKYIIYLSVATLLVGLLVPMGIDAIANTTGTNWNPAVLTAFKVLLPIMIILSIALAFMPREIKARVGL
jgi:hypothetical protein